MASANKRNQYLGFVEGIMTCLVVMIHCRFPGKTGEILATFFWIAVPFFFSVSGFFYYNSDVSISLSRTKRKILHLLPMLIGAEFFYYLWYVFLQIRKSGFSFKSFSVVIRNELAAYELSNLLIPVPLFAPVCWFVIQLIIIYLIIHRVIDRNHIMLAYMLSPVLLLLGAATSIISYLLNGFYPAFNITRFPLFMGFPYFMGGYFIREHSAQLRKAKQTTIVIMALLGVGLIFTQRQLFSYIGSYIGHAFLLFAVWLWILRQPPVKTDIIVCIFDVFGEKYSMYVFLFHIWVFGLMDTLIGWGLPSFANLRIWGWIRPFAACVASAVFAVVIRKIILIVGSLRREF